MTLPTQHAQHPPTSVPFQSSPAALADVLNPLDEQRDSAYFSSASTKGEQSKHNSLAHTTQHNSLVSARSSVYHQSHSPSDSNSMTPSPINPRGQPLPSPISGGGMPLNTMVSSPNPVSPTESNNMDANMLAKLNTQAPAYTLTAPNSTRASMVSQADSFSRRNSVDGRMNNDFNGLRLGNSPYASANQSTTSIQSSLQQQRNPGHLSASSAAGRLSDRFNNAYQPQSHRYGASKIAPTITGPAASAVANAAEPTKGQPWAFPDDVSDRQVGASETSFSRRSSIAESMASSQFTSTSHLPHGQRRLEDGYAHDIKPSQSMEFKGANGQSAAGYHHHPIANRKVSEIRDEEGTSPGGTSTNGTKEPGQYSRNPEHRKSHKMAERKRRNEMKELYEELKELLPSERGNKNSKWEVLSKSINQHRLQADRCARLESHIHELQERLVQVHAENVREISHLRDENLQLRADNRELRQQLAQFNRNGSIGAASSVGMNGATEAYGAPQQQQESSYPQAHNHGHGSVSGPPRHEAALGGVGLPPLRTVTTEVGIGMRSGGFTAPPSQGDAMSGVQYQNERTTVGYGYSR